QRTPVRARYINWRMLRDVKRRNLVKEYGPIRLRVNAIRKNTIIPREIQEMADSHIASFPRDSCRNRTTNRCVMTSRPRGNLRRWRLSRIMWRHLADYNKLSGVTRASW
ncbi:28S ribosomal protein S14, mitochondrial, partial [Lamellibrachia satsuma]